MAMSIKVDRLRARDGRPARYVGHSLLQTRNGRAPLLGPLASLATKTYASE